MSAADDGGVLRRFLNTVGSAAGQPVVDPSDPVSVAGVIGTIGAGIFARLTVGLASLPEAGRQAVTTVIGGPSSFLTELVTTPLQLIESALKPSVGPLGRVFDAGVEASVGAFGPFALPVATVIALAAAYVLIRGGRTAAGVDS